ncbi:MAG: sigma-70 family RNA polymerase sigma factor, partial [Ginsengibacter sp.]
MSHRDDLIIIENVLAGNTHAYAHLVDAYKDIAVNLAYNITLNREDAEEVAQDAFVKAFTALRSFKRTAKFSTWLYRIVINTAINKKRQRKIGSIELNEVHSQAISKDDNSALPGEIKKHVQLAMQYLNEKERICITLYYLQEMSVEEINEVTGYSRANIKILLYRGRKNLYDLLHKHLKHEISSLI